MHISIKGLCTSEMTCNLSLDFAVEGTTVIHDEREELASAILKCLVDTTFITTGGIELNGIPLQHFFEKNSILKTFGYIFDTGIMLSNISIRENFLLPYQLRWKKTKSNVFEKELTKWLDIFQIKIDLSNRPANIKPPILKLLCYIRSLLLEPNILLIDNPYYLLDKHQRKLLYQILNTIKIPMVIASTDDDFIETLADTVIFLHEKGDSSIKKIAKT